MGDIVYQSMDVYTCNVSVDKYNTEPEWKLEGKSLIWAVLERLSTDVKSYRSDLYHDALTIAALKPIEQTFYFCTNPCGTNIYLTYCDFQSCKHFHTHHYKCTLTFSPAYALNYIRRPMLFTVVNITSD